MKVEDEAVRLGGLDVPAVVEMESEVGFDVPDGLRVLVGQEPEEVGEALRVLGDVLSLAVKQRVDPGRVPSLHLAGVELVHRPHRAEKALPGDLHVEVQELEVIPRRLLRPVLHDFLLLRPLEGVERHPVRGHEVEVVAGDPVDVRLRGLQQLRRGQGHLQADLGGLQRQVEKGPHEVPGRRARERMHQRSSPSPDRAGTRPLRYFFSWKKASIFLKFSSTSFL